MPNANSSPPDAYGQPIDLDRLDLTGLRDKNADLLAALNRWCVCHDCRDGEEAKAMLGCVWAAHDALVAELDRLGLLRDGLSDSDLKGASARRRAIIVILSNRASLSDLRRTSDLYVGTNWLAGPLHQCEKAAKLLALLVPSDGPSIRCINKTWHIRYRTEAGDFPASRTQCIAWLAKLLAAPNRMLTLADLRGDPEGKLAADALLGAEPETDREGAKAIRRRLQEIDEITDETGISVSLEEEKAQLLASMKDGCWWKKLKTRLQSDHANIATQFRNFCRKLKDKMPWFAEHLKASLQLNYPEFGYYPPSPPPDWQF
jgi:hypothetical protein